MLNPFVRCRGSSLPSHVAAEACRCTIALHEDRIQGSRQIRRWPWDCQSSSAPCHAHRRDGTLPQEPIVSDVGMVWGEWSPGYSWERGRRMVRSERSWTARDVYFFIAILSAHHKISRGRSRGGRTTREEVENVFFCSTGTGTRAGAYFFQRLFLCEGRTKGRSNHLIVEMLRLSISISISISIPLYLYLLIKQGDILSFVPHMILRYVKYTRWY